MATRKRNHRKAKRKKREQAERYKPKQCLHRIVVMGVDVGQCSQLATRWGYCRDHLASQHSLI